MLAQEFFLALDGHTQHHLDALYLCAQSGEEEDGDDYIDKIKKTDKKYIVIDEYTWISNRKLWFTCP